MYLVVPLNCHTTDLHFSTCGFYCSRSPSESRALHKQWFCGPWWMRALKLPEEITCPAINCPTVFMNSSKPWQGGSVGPPSHTPKGWGFDSRLGHIPRLQVWSLVGVHMEGKWSLFVFHISVSLSLSLSQINKHSLMWGLKKKEFIQESVFNLTPVV